MLRTLRRHGIWFLLALAGCRERSSERPPAVDAQSPVPAGPSARTAQPGDVVLTQHEPKSVAPPAESASVTAARWLDAQRRGDAAGMKALVALPLEVGGFIPPNGMDCGPRSKTLSVEFRVTSPELLDKALKCLLSDVAMTRYVPAYPVEQWPKAPHPTPRAGDYTGYLVPADASRLPARLASRAPALGGLAAGDSAFEVFWTDSGGLSVHALLIVRDGRIRSAFFDELFEE